MTGIEQRLAVLERRCAADVRERMLQIAAAVLGIDPEVLRADVEQLAVEARAYPTSEEHLASVAASLNITVDDLEREARRLETAARGF